MPPEIDRFELCKVRSLEMVDKDIQCRIDNRRAEKPDGCALAFLVGGLLIPLALYLLSFAMHSGSDPDAGKGLGWSASLVLPLTAGVFVIACWVIYVWYRRQQ